ncbi:microtubule-associated protein 6 isoform X1 [Poecilia latipinna]|uniref:microtubule-associated protein 6 isoform X1 n=1 Tax=Poecilia latipinna TaxID=48699 RepID=UPI00072DE479|nr:PREDICTED: microtubule-associated protein 6-like isoform X1 [Poecilia latipinna]XP_014898114.1 PREDICTED: microtubule-associated protein 6-like isoform X1 [Poecilia latipinna]
MAWPCISRVCCLARFWNQFDKSDLSVPLTIQNYSDIAEQEVRSVTKQLSDSENNYTAPEPRVRGSPHAPADGPRGPSRARREPSYKPREDYHPPGVPFPSVTQYKQDFKPWPIPRKDNFPWISNGGSRGDGASDSSPVNSFHLQAQVGERRGDRLEQQVTEENKTSSYRQEYRPWTGVKPARSARRNPTAQYSSPVGGATHIPRETSYQAAYSGEVSRAMSGQKAELIPPSAASNIQPLPAAQHNPAATRAGSSLSPSSLQQSILPQTTEHSGTTKREVGMRFHRASFAQVGNRSRPLQKVILTHLPGGPLAAGASQKSDTAFCPRTAQSDPAV